jgi:hypothetical protein
VICTTARQDQDANFYKAFSIAVQVFLFIISQSITITQSLYLSHPPIANMRSVQFTSAIALAIGLFVSNVSATIDLGDSLGTNCKPKFGLNLK